MGKRKRFIQPSAIKASVVIVFLSAILIPGIQSSSAFMYGYPIAFLEIRKVVHLDTSSILLTEFNFLLLMFLADIILVSITFSALILLATKLRKNPANEGDAAEE